MLYAILSWCSRQAIRWCYREVQIRGTLPATGPVILAVNHPNELVDVCLVLGLMPRRVTFVANAASAAEKIVDWTYRQLGVVPVVRPRDTRKLGVSPEESARTNATAFSRVREALAGGACIVLFPEGGTHRGPHLDGLRTGIARMALDARDNGAVRGLRIVPVGIAYEAPYSLRSRIALRIGDAIHVDTWQPAHDHAPESQLTATVAAALRTVTRNAPDWDSHELLRQVAEAAACTDGAIDLHAGTRRWQVVEQTIFGPGHSAQPAQSALTASARALAEQLQRITNDAGLGDVPRSRWLAAWIATLEGRNLRTASLVMSALPALLGGFLHLPAWALCRVVAKRNPPDPLDVMARTFVPGLYVMVVWYALLLATLLWLLRTNDMAWGVALAVSALLMTLLPRLGDFAMLWWDRWTDRLLARTLTRAHFRLPAAH
jgi:1-acyl-sn-glycerol-3-phosphate acyltransferase